MAISGYTEVPLSEAPLIDVDEISDATPSPKRSPRALTVALGVVAVLVLAGVAIKSRFGQPSQLEDSNANENEAIERNGPAPCTNINPCGVYIGQYSAAGKACCDKSCGNYCGAPDCQLGPKGFAACCTKKFVHPDGTPELCGEHLGGANFRAAPCVLPGITQGTLQMLFRNGAGGGRRLATGDLAKAIKKDVADAFNSAYEIPVSLIRTMISPRTPLTAGGRRLAMYSPLNVMYVLRHTDGAVTVDTWKKGETELVDKVKNLINANGLISVAQVHVPPPETLPPGSVATADGVTTTPVPPLPATEIDESKPEVVKGSQKLSVDPSLTREQVEHFHETAMSAITGVALQQIVSVATEVKTAHEKEGVTRKLASELGSVPGQWFVEYSISHAGLAEVQQATAGAIQSHMATTLKNAGLPPTVTVAEVVPPQIGTTPTPSTTAPMPVATTTAAPVATTAAPVATTAAPVATTTAATTPVVTTTAAPTTSAAYTCGSTDSSNCLTEYNNAVTNGDIASFCIRCATENGANPLRSQCSKCCQAPCQGGATTTGLTGSTTAAATTTAKVAPTPAPAPTPTPTPTPSPTPTTTVPAR